MWGGKGDDTFYGGAGTNVMHGGSGTDVMYAETGNQTMYAGSGPTTMYGGSGTNTMIGGSGTDTFWAGTGVDLMTGGTGHDTFGWSTVSVVQATGLDKVSNFAANDTLNLHELLTGHAYGSINDVVHFREVAGGEVLSVDLGLGLGFKDVAMLSGVHNSLASALLSTGQLYV